MTVELLAEDGSVRDVVKKRIGIRTLTISQEKDRWGQEFAFIVNGVKIFTKGGNYIPEDCCYTRITKERQEYLVRSCVRANFNCLRVWGGGYYPSDALYDLCDKYGLIVWQDLMYACNVYDVTDAFAENIRQETLDNVRRLRHHACLGLWCGNNEIESAWDHWGDFQKETPYLRADYVKQFEQILPHAVREADPDTFYWPSSPSSGGCFDEPDSEDRGDTHYWDVWHGQKPFSDYRKYFFRFCSEFGFQSFPSYKTVESFTEEEDRNIFSKVMESHQKNDAANGKMLYYLSENFRYPKDFKSLTLCDPDLTGDGDQKRCGALQQKPRPLYGNALLAGQTTGQWHPGRVSIISDAGKRCITRQNISTRRRRRASVWRERRRVSIWKTKRCAGSSMRRSLS